MIFALFPRVDRLRMMRPFLKFYQKSGLQSLVRSWGLMNFLPEELQAMEALLPKLGPKQEIAASNPALGIKRKRVGLMLGCVQREFSPEINAATGYNPGGMLTWPN